MQSYLEDRLSTADSNVVYAIAYRSYFYCELVSTAHTERSFDGNTIAWARA
jgi:hypothetical protein